MNKLEIIDLLKDIPDDTEIFAMSEHCCVVANEIQQIDYDKDRRIAVFMPHKDYYSIDAINNQKDLVNKR